ncbi:reverse transcriptase domain-containing protein [Tanacetum coccineum]
MPNDCIHNTTDLHERFAERFALRRKCSRDLMEVSKIIQRANETLPDFKEHWTEEMSYIQGVLEVMQISSFMSNSKCPELARCFADQVPQTMTEMMKRVDYFVKSEEAYKNTLLKGEHLVKGQGTSYKGTGHLARVMEADTKGWNTTTPTVVRTTISHMFLHGHTTGAIEGDTSHRAPTLATSVPPMVETPKKENLNKFYDYHEEKGNYTNDCYQLKRKVDAALESRKLSYLVKDVRLSVARRKGSDPERRLDEEALKNKKHPAKDEMDHPTLPKCELEHYSGGAKMKGFMPGEKQSSNERSGRMGQGRHREAGLNITEENKDDYRWTEYAEHAFQEMKKLIIELPTLTTPGLRETLYVYLAASKDAVSGVLVVDRKGKQTPIRYVSQTLHDAERNYAPLEKLALCLLHLSRRLRRYFEAHAIKGKVLEDFINEVLVGTKHLEIWNLADEESLEEWTLYTDRASSSKGVGVSLVLIDPTGTKYTYAIRLNFPSTNNEEEYEALLAGLQIAEKMKARALKVKVDSKLVACQLNGEFVASS